MAPPLPKSEKLILQAELRRAWGVADCLIGVVATCLGLVDSLRDRLAQKTMENDGLKKEITNLKRMLSVHESWNHSSREAVLFVKKRKEFQRRADGRIGGEDEDGSACPAGRRCGHQPGTRGVSHVCKPTETKTCQADMCKNCGRTDTQPEGMFWKVVLDLTRCGKMVCHVEETVPAYCIGCGTVTHPETGTIAGSSLGPGLRRIITNIHAVVPSVRSIQKLLASNHGVTLSTGCISNCLSGTAGRAKGDCPETIPDHAEIPLVSKAPLRPPADHGSYDQSRDAVWSGTMAAAVAATTAAAATTTQPLLRQIEEKISMAPYVQIDESRKNIGGRQAQALVLDTEHAVLIRIEKDKSRKTMEGAFWMVLNRPFVADMYRGGYTFGGEFQSCFVHVSRKSEGLAIRHGIDSLEYVLYVMMRGIYHDAKAAAARTLEMAGGQAAQSACDIGAAVRTVPGLAEHVESSRSDLLKRLGKVAHAYRNGAVSDDASREFAGTLENAMPYLLTFIGHPGMEGSTNACERTIRGYVVRPRNIQRILPNRRAAENLATLQTIHATCAKRGMFSGDAVTACDSWNMFEAGTPPPILPNLK